MPASFSINPNLARELTIPFVNRIVRQAVNEAKRECPVDEGRLRSSIDGTVSVRGATVVGRIGTSVSYALYVHEGRGPITASPGKVLRFKPKGSQVFIFRKSVGPAAGKPFLVNGLQAALLRNGLPGVVTPR